MPKICIQNLGKYNEGVLLFEWVDLPVSDEELDRIYDKIKICHNGKDYYNDCGCPYEEIMLADWEDWGDYPINEWSNIDELNEVAEFIDSLDEVELEIFNFFISDGYDFEDAKDRVELGEYSYIKATDDTDLAYEYIDNVYGKLEFLSRETLERYFDYESFGRDLAMDYYKTENGYILIT